MVHDKDLKNIIGYLEKMGLLIEGLKPNNPTLTETESIAFTRKRKVGEGMFATKAIIIKTDGDFYLGGYQAMLQTNPEIIHGNWKGVNTIALEKQLQSVNWPGVMVPIHRSELEILLPLEKLSLLSSSASQQARATADRLTLKFLAGTPIESVLPPIACKKDFQSEIQVDLNRNDGDLDSSEAYQLLRGMAVEKNIGQGTGYEERYWLTAKDGRIRQHENQNLALLALSDGNASRMGSNSRKQKSTLRKGAHL
jgi:hypothetical protein